MGLADAGRDRHARANRERGSRRSQTVFERGDRLIQHLAAAGVPLG